MDNKNEKIQVHSLSVEDMPRYQHGISNYNANIYWDDKRIQNFGVLIPIALDSLLTKQDREKLFDQLAPAMEQDTPFLVRQIEDHSNIDLLGSSWLKVEIQGYTYFQLAD